jgi:hypothetical protein
MMTTKFSVFLFFASIFTSAFSFAAGDNSLTTISCENLFSSSTSNILIHTKTEGVSTLKIIDQGFDPDPQIAALKIINAALKTAAFLVTEKNFIDKDNLILGFSLPSNYSLEVTYVSNSMVQSQFVIKKIQLISPTGQKKNISSDLIQIDEFKLAADYFELSDNVLFHADIHLKLPLTIEAVVLKELTKYSSSFDLFSKDELRNIFITENTKKIKSKLFARKAIELFKKVLIKEPFKLLIGGIMMFSVLSINDHFHLIQKAPVLPIPTYNKPIEKTEFKSTVKDLNGDMIPIKIQAAELNQNTILFKVSK